MAHSESSNRSRTFRFCRSRTCSCKRFLRRNDRSQHVDRLVEAFQLQHLIADLRHRHQDRVRLLAGPAARAATAPSPDAVKQRLEPPIAFGEHLLADLPQRIGDVVLQAYPQFFGVDAIVDQFLANVVESRRPRRGFLASSSRRSVAPARRASPWRAVAALRLFPAGWLQSAGGALTVGAGVRAHGRRPASRESPSPRR